jgi:CheY-like chemotaxis protein
MPGSNHLILCVDDETVGLLVRKTLLEKAGYRVLTAPNGPQGLELFTQNPVDGVILDYSMPGMHGGEVASHMRTAKPEVPILLLSAYTSLPADLLQRVDSYMTKGEGPQMLLEKLSQMLSRASTFVHPRELREP